MSVLREAVAAFAESYQGMVDKTIYVVSRTEKGPEGFTSDKHSILLGVTPEGAEFSEYIQGKPVKLTDTGYIESIDDYKAVADSPVEHFWSYNRDLMREVFLEEKKRM